MCGTYWSCKFTDLHPASDGTAHAFAQIQNVCVCVCVCVCVFVFVFFISIVRASWLTNFKGVSL